MGLGSFYKQRKPRSFDHKPIYYDQRRDELEKRIERIRREVEQEQAEQDGQSSSRDYSGYHPRIRGTFVEGTQHLKERQLQGETQSTRSGRTLRTLALLVAVCLLSWLVFKVIL
ncbi:hypothetical protein HQ50_08000 [Porphyromonas sp. COT-052 OH4946]|uniref:hypothetical protein n=1 Tax=Porphyromonas sp. COT-052 OH4946 TaxID=1515618 RepID=UPI00051DAFAD|nr:hypothetical protein [Porphyromonas sp. COT-052 OH4946]KGL55013.1 hypothetical protein HQ50_08000 [Porphyromonas sp. COT-052 OH4946]